MKSATDAIPTLKLNPPRAHVRKRLRRSSDVLLLGGSAMVRPGRRPHALCGHAQLMSTSSGQLLDMNNLRTTYVEGRSCASFQG